MYLLGNLSVEHELKQHFNEIFRFRFVCIQQPAKDRLSNLSNQQTNQLVSIGQSGSK